MKKYEIGDLDQNIHDIEKRRELVMVYADDDNCGSIDKWKDNMTFIKYHQLKF